MSTLLHHQSNTINEISGRLGTRNFFQHVGGGAENLAEVASQYRPQLPNLVRVAKVLDGLDDVVEILSAALGADYVTHGPRQKDSHHPPSGIFHRLDDNSAYCSA
jgi:hypothetical protein